MPSLVLADYILKRHPDKRVCLVDRDSQVGGQFGGFVDEKSRVWDYGAHIYYDACVPEYDSLLQRVMPDDEWHIYAGNEKDISGIFWNGRLQKNIPYPDLRDFPEEKKAQYLYEIVANSARSIEKGTTARECLEAHFGESLARDIFIPIIEGLYKAPAEELHPQCLKLQAVNRVTLFEEEVNEVLLGNPALSSRLAMADQMNPRIEPYKSPQRALYPRKYGFLHVMRRYQTQLEARGADFFLDVGIQELQSSGDRVGAVRLTNDMELQVSDTLFWNAGLIPLALTLDKELLKSATRPRKTKLSYVYFLLREKPRSDDLYYFYAFDKGSDIFRVTFYDNYCPSPQEDGFRICVEYWESESSHMSDDEIISRCTTDLEGMGVIEHEDIKESFVKKKSYGGVPILTKELVDFNGQLYTNLSSRTGKNTVIGGALAGNLAFFVFEVIKSNIEKYEALIGEAKC